MVRPSLEVADVFAAHADAFLASRGDVVSSAKRLVLRKLVACRTAALGGHVDACDQCDHEAVSYNSCRDRHCPKCQASARAEWLDARAADLLPVEYFHVVFTVPDEIAAIALQNKKTMYDILLRASAQTLLQIAADPKHLGARIGFVSVLHTWGQTLQHHPHVHCVVPGGGLGLDGDSRWIGSQPGFFLPVRVLSRLFRGKFLALTRRAFRAGKLTFQGGLEELSDGERFEARLRRATDTEWVVYAKPPFGGPEQVLKYLARYTHRVAISNHRLVSLHDGRVTFRHKDYAHGHRPRTMTLDAVEFIRRFLLHVLPKGFVRIRHYGLLANSCRRDRLAACRSALECPTPEEPCDSSAPASVAQDDARCPACKVGRLHRRRLEPARPAAVPIGIDSS